MKKNRRSAISRLAKYGVFFAGLVFCLGNQDAAAQVADTVFAGKPLPNAALIQSGEARFIMLIQSSQPSPSIKYLDRVVSTEKDRLIVVQKLMNGTYTNTDSVIVDRHTLAPLESYSDINTSSDSFVYKDNHLTGTMISREGNDKGKITTIDSTFARARTMFNGLIYAETFQSLSYTRNKPVVLAEYVPGHQAKFTRVEYVKDDQLDFLGTTISVRVIKVMVNNNALYYWLNSKDQGLIKIEAKFPGFTYWLLRTI